MPWQEGIDKPKTGMDASGKKSMLSFKGHQRRTTFRFSYLIIKQNYLYLSNKSLFQLNLLPLFNSDCHGTQQKHGDFQEIQLKKGKEKIVISNKL